MTSNLISLWGLMRKFNAAGCCGFFAVLGQHAQIASIASNPVSVKTWFEAMEAGGHAIQDEVPEGRLKSICDDLQTHVLTFCAEADLHQSAKLITNICDIQFATLPVRMSELQWVLDGLRRLMISEMEEKMFFCISEPSAKMFDDPFPMMKEVSEAFPDAREDIKEAYNSWVLERNTAAVFHAMRVAEHGLKGLAKKLKVKLTHKGKPQPIETAVWEKIIMAIKNKIAAAHAMPYGARREKQLSYYSDMADRCSYMKDLWRNNIMHSRISFNHSEASGALQRVSGFMQLLASNPWAKGKEK